MSGREAYLAYLERFFDGWLPYYDLFAASIGWAYGAAVRRVEACPGRSVLDVATGTGEIALRCARRGAEVTGVDVTPAMLARAAAKAKRLPVRFELMDARHLGFPDASFDVAVLSFALHDMPRRVRVEVLAEAARVAREKLVLLDYRFPRSPGWWRRSLVAAVGRVETAYFPGFVRQGMPSLLAAAGLVGARETRLAGGLFAVWEVRTAAARIEPAG